MKTLPQEKFKMTFNNSALWCLLGLIFLKPFQVIVGLVLIPLLYFLFYKGGVIPQEVIDQVANASYVLALYFAYLFARYFSKRSWKRKQLTSGIDSTQ